MHEISNGIPMTEMDTIAPMRGPQSGPGNCDAELARLASAWPNLPAHIRTAILALVEGECEQGGKA